MCSLHPYKNMDIEIFSLDKTAKVIAEINSEKGSVEDNKPDEQNIKDQHDMLMNIKAAYSKKR